MKRNDLLSALIDMALAFLMTIAGVGCLTTAFALDVNMAAVAWVTLFFTGLGILCIRMRRGWLLLVLTALLSLLLLRKLEISYDFLSMLNRILSLYELGYGWEVPEFIADCADPDLTLSAQTIAGFLGLFAAVYLSRCLHSLSALAVILPVMPCILLTDTVPAPEYLLLAIITLALLALTDHARRTDTRQANRLTALLLIPVLLSGMLLLRQFPRSEYQPPDISRNMFALMERLAEKIPFLNQTPNPDLPIRGAVDTVDLNNVGRRPQSNTTILEVVASQSGALYLRGRSYLDYTGTSWQAFSEKEKLELPGSDYLTEQTQTIRIHALQDLSIRYFPYYPGNVWLENGSLEGQVEDTYLLRYHPVRADWKQQWFRKHGPMGIDQAGYALLSDYTRLPASTAAGALEHLRLAGVNTKASIPKVAEAIAEYVKKSARYDLNTGRMPTAQPDFALWFLNDSETGYCIHFASAAAVLLRAAGIPARYVEGYLVDAVAGQTTQIRGMHAHAWVEYYVPELGWMLLEATPSEGLPVVLPTEPTQPEPTTRPTEPTQPTVPTEPTVPTVPTVPTEPTAPTLPTAPTTRPTEPTTPSQTTQPTSPTEPQGSTLPGIGGPGGDNERFDWSRLLPLLRRLLAILAFCAAMVGQWKLRLHLRRRRMAGTAFIHILRRWRYACLLARLCGHKEPKPLLALVKKAKFSRNGLNSRELRQFDRYYRACIQGLQKLPWPKRLALRLLFAAW